MWHSCSSAYYKSLRSSVWILIWKMPQSKKNRSRKNNYIDADAFVIKFNIWDTIFIFKDLVSLKNVFELKCLVNAWGYTVIDWKTWSQKLGTFTSVLVDDQIHSAIYHVHFSFLQWNILVTSITLDLWSIIRTIFWMNYVHMFTVKWFIYSHIHVYLKHICIIVKRPLGAQVRIELQYSLLVVPGRLNVAVFRWIH